MFFLSFLLFAASVSSTHTHTFHSRPVSFRCVGFKTKAKSENDNNLSNIIILYESKNNNAKTQQDHEYKWDNLERRQCCFGQEDEDEDDNDEEEEEEEKGGEENEEGK